MVEISPEELEELRNGKEKYDRLSRYRTQYKRTYNKLPKVKLKNKEWYEKNKERINLRLKQPEVREKIRERMRGYRQTPQFQERIKKSNQKRREKYHRNKMQQTNTLSLPLAIKVQDEIMQLFVPALIEKREEEKLIDVPKNDSQLIKKKEKRIWKPI